ncbi:hypothetical protein DICPUDRAFT_42446 [Dictyostelium purpureum]|uniref:NADAR domain-containing protein n=1 Tax=Dictyostelium purpureum TaxID=5786 RepID=F1A231_DICPU|nr:uncharacterized protein DICPUDRAFT_42446 [Dictyostelium purpureum]EGC29752.1 hypothetical protein DICPUDRAFT_42446 [Dictyostelium purpureum]|eukprot:XP_003293720.1 hypothetical protein DICPUDRAFT_42446 [Dictyostelium purpureum]
MSTNLFLNQVYTPNKKLPQIKTNSGELKFYNQGQDFYEFTNFYESPFYLDGKLWTTSEHYFQAQKFSPYQSLIEHVRNLPSPREAFNFTKKPDLQIDIRKDWHEIKDIIMYNALFAKFTQNHYLRQLLLSTGDMKLIEDSPIDNYWGVGKDGTGKNKLGETLMDLRRSLNMTPSL